MGNLVIGGLAQRNDPSETTEVYVDVSTGAKQTAGRFKVDKLVNVQAVQNSVAQVFNWIPGERVLLPEFGSNLRKLLYRGITKDTEEAIIAEIRHSLTEWEPRVELDSVVNVSTVDDTEQNTIRLQIVYRIKGLSDKQFEYTYEYRRATV